MDLATKERAALQLMMLKVQRQLCEGKTTCTLDENDVQEILFIAGMSFDTKKEKRMEDM